MAKLFKWLKKHLLAISLILGGILDQTTDLLPQLLIELDAPDWTATLLRIVIISLGAIRLYLAKPYDKEVEIGGCGIKNPPTP